MYLLWLAMIGCGGKSDVKSASSGTTEQAKPATAADAKAFVDRVDHELHTVWSTAELAEWTLATDITDAHEAEAAKANEAVMKYLSETIPQTTRFDGLELDTDTRRKLDLLKLSVGVPSPDDDVKRARLAEVVAKLGSMYGKGQWCDADGNHCQDLGALEAIINDVSKTPAERLVAWDHWREVAKPMRPLYTEFVDLGNEGARVLGFKDQGELWRSQYDMSPEDFEKEVDRLYAQLQPLYEQLHCHVRAELNKKYGDETVPPKGAIPAHLLGNMWGQSWGGLYGDLTPYPNEPSLDITSKLVEQEWDHIKMTKTAEGFFVSMGLDPLPETFYERSMLLKPKDREAVCHASAWDIGMKDDLRIKMCIQPDAENLYTLHHELGHNYYFHYYYTLPVLYQSGANDGFHEAIGDAVMLSVTPEYLQSLGLLDQASATDEAVINKQLQKALDAIAFLPFGRMIDQWRWDVFSGEVPPEQYNEHWWKLRGQFQGLAPANERPADAFDPGAKYHIPGNTPYMRYFLAQVLQYQFHEAMCEASGYEGPLHACSIHGSKEAGDRLKKMLAMGASKPWPDALEAITGKRQMDASSLVRYYEPLTAWLKEQNAERECGW